MTLQAFILLIIGVAIIIGAILSAWAYMKLSGEVEKKNKKKNNA